MLICLAARAVAFIIYFRMSLTYNALLMSPFIFMFLNLSEKRLHARSQKLPVLFGSCSHHFIPLPPQIWWSLRPLKRLKPPTRMVSRTTAQGRDHKQTHLSSTVLNAVCETSLNSLFLPFPLKLRRNRTRTDATSVRGAVWPFDIQNYNHSSWFTWWWNLSNIPHTEAVQDGSGEFNSITRQMHIWGGLLNVKITCWNVSNSGGANWSWRQQHRCVLRKKTSLRL